MSGTVCLGVSTRFLLCVNSLLFILQSRLHWPGTALFPCCYLGDAKHSVLETFLLRCSLLSPTAGQQGPGTSTHPRAGQDLAPGLGHAPCAAVSTRVTLALKGFQDEKTVIRGKKNILLVLPGRVSAGAGRKALAPCVGAPQTNPSCRPLPFPSALAPGFYLRHQLMARGPSSTEWLLCPWSRRSPPDFQLNRRGQSKQSVPWCNIPCISLNLQ